MKKKSSKNSSSSAIFSLFCHKNGQLIENLRLPELSGSSKMSVEIAQVPIIPKKSDLFGSKTVECPDCLSVFKSQSNLALHLIKVHKKNDVTLTSRDQGFQLCFYCPEERCLYNRDRNLEENQNHFFTEFKLLKQVSEKNFNHLVDKFTEK